MLHKNEIARIKDNLEYVLIIYMFQTYLTLTDSGNKDSVILKNEREMHVIDITGPSIKRKK